MGPSQLRYLVVGLVLQLFGWCTLTCALGFWQSSTQVDLDRLLFPLLVVSAVAACQLTIFYGLRELLKLPHWRDGRIAQYMPSLFRVQRSKNIRLANLMDPGRVTAPGESFPLVAGGNGTDPRTWNSVLWQNGDELCDPLEAPDACHATRVLDRPVLWELGAGG